jgi:hypothetical protein
MAEWLIPVLTFITGGLGGYLGASQKVVVLEVHVKDLMKWRESANAKMTSYNEDILIHDIELQAVMTKLAIPRAKRQRFRKGDSTS